MADRLAPHIPVLRDAHDSLRAGGPRSLALEAAACHSVEAIQNQHLKTTWDADLYRIERVYGRAAAWEKRMDRAVFSQVQRLPGVPSSHIAIDHVLGRDTRIGWEDVLGLPEHRPQMPRMGVHDVMERKLGMF